jgi:hypothetical protein
MAERWGDRSLFEKAIVRGGFNGMEAWMFLAVEKASELAPVDTGRLVRSILTDDDFPREEQPFIFEGQIGTFKLEYAAAQELGSGLYGPKGEKITITAGFWTGKSDKKALAFAWPDGPKPHKAFDEESGKYIFRSVEHPGVRAANQGRGFLRPGSRLTARDGARLVALAMTHELKRANPTGP